MKKIFIFVFFLLNGAIVIWFYENHKIAKLAEARSLFWQELVDGATESGLTTDQFIAKYGHEAHKVTKVGQLATLIDTRSIKSFTCAQYTYEIVYSNHPDGGSNLTMVSGGCYKQ